MNVAEIPTPALLIEVAPMERNIRRMAAFFAEGPCRLRPHVKAHKTPEIARRQLAAGSCSGLTCATVEEAESVSAFCDDILLANEIVTADKCDRLAALARRSRVTVAVDSIEGIHQISAASVRAGVTVGVFVDVNVGQERCGVAPGEDALALARLVPASAGVELRGVMGYEGHLQGIADRSERERRARAAMDQLAATATLLRAHGLVCEIVSAGGTGTYDISGRVSGITEIQAGSYALMDTDYARVGVPFEQALFVLGTVISRPAPDRCVLDAGHKHVTKDHGLPAVASVPDAEVTGLFDEHATLRIPPASSIAIGDRVRLVPSHVDPTMNLHDVIYAVDGESVVGVWAIARRGPSSLRFRAPLRGDGL